MWYIYIEKCDYTNKYTDKKKNKCEIFPSIM